MGEPQEQGVTIGLREIYDISIQTKSAVESLNTQVMLRLSNLEEQAKAIPVAQQAAHDAQRTADDALKLAKGVRAQLNRCKKWAIGIATSLAVAAFGAWASHQKW